jgi:hypothetical protein
MTGIDLCVIKFNQSRSYLNHLVLPSHLGLDLSSGLFASDFKAETLYFFCICMQWIRTESLWVSKAVIYVEEAFVFA